MTCRSPRGTHARRQIKPSTFDKLLSGPLKRLQELDEEEQYRQLRLAKDFWDDAGDITKEGQITSLMLACKLGNKKAKSKGCSKKADVHIKRKAAKCAPHFAWRVREECAGNRQAAAQANANANELDASTAITRSSDDQAVYQRTPSYMRAITVTMRSYACCSRTKKALKSRPRPTSMLSSRVAHCAHVGLSPWFQAMRRNTDQA